MAIFDPKAKAIAGYQRTIDEKNKSIVKYYDQIGRLYYGQYKDMSVDVTKDINARCDAVSDLYKEIKELEHKILFEKGLKLCTNCGKENMLSYAFCFGCGTKFESEEDKATSEKSAPEKEEVVEISTAVEETEEVKVEEVTSEENKVEEVKDEETVVEEAKVENDDSSLLPDEEEKTE